MKTNYICEDIKKMTEGQIKEFVREEVQKVVAVEINRIFQKFADDETVWPMLREHIECNYLGSQRDVKDNPRDPSDSINFLSIESRESNNI